MSRRAALRSAVAALSLLAVSALAPASAHAGADPFAAAPTGIGTQETGGEASANALAVVDPTTGTAHASLVLDLPTARGAVQPTLAITYDSSAGLRELGFGWGLGGVPHIERRHPSGARGMPTNIDPPNMGSDRFYFEGKPLVPVCVVNYSDSGHGCGTADRPERVPGWANGWTYFRLEVEGEFARFFWSPDGTTWVVQRKSGETIELGAPLDAKADMRGVDRDESGHYFRWNVVRRHDTQGIRNRVVYVWDSGDTKGIRYLTDIYDTPDEKENFAHRTHLDYEVRASAHADFSPRWHAVPQQRLTRVTITSASLSSTSRELVRAYHFTYFEDDRDTLLTSLQMEGRCDGPTSESAALAGQTNCTPLPATRFDYGVPPSPSPVQTLSGPAPDPADGPVFVDVNSDGLPDIVVPSRDPRKPQDLYLNSAFGVPRWLTHQKIEIASSLLGATNANFLSADKADRAILGNFLGDGRLSAIWRDGTSVAYYTPFDLGGGSWTWWGGASADMLPVEYTSPRNYPFTTTFGDVDGDGIVDLVGNYDWTHLSERDAAQTIRPFSKAIAAVPGRALPSLGPVCDSGFHWDAPSDWLTQHPGGAPFVTPPSEQLADFNGDGLLDRVQVQGKLEFRCVDHDHNLRVSCGGPVMIDSCKQWDTRLIGVELTVDAGLGDGTFAPSLGSSIEVVLPSWQPVGRSIALGDVNGDGRADLLVSHTSGVWMWPGIPDGFVRTNFGPADDSFGSAQIQGWDADKCKVRVADIDGSGTGDIVVVCPGGNDSVTYKSFDTSNGGHPVHDLRSISNGRGVTTDIEYVSTATLSAIAPPATRWGTPQPMHVVSKVTTRNHLPGKKEESHTTGYKYSEPVYDGLTQSFRGFRDVVVSPIGNGDGSASSTHTRFLVGHCDEDVHHPCVRAVDRPVDALRGLPVLVESFAAGPTASYASTTHFTYRVNRLYQGLDGHIVRSVYAEQVDKFLYDTTPFIAGRSSPQFQEVDAVNDPTLVSTVNVPLRAAATHLQTKRTVDGLGNEVESWDLGRVDTHEDSPVHTLRHWSAFGPDAWLWRTDSVQVDGAGAWSGKRYARADYDDRGQVFIVNAWLEGSLPLDRHHEDTTKPIAPPPADASANGWIQVARYTYDDWGNVIHVAGPSGSCVDAGFDPLFHQMRTSSTSYVGAPGPGGCGSVPLTSITSSDRGLEVVTMSAGPTGAITLATYDGFGRPKTVSRPSAVPHPTTKFDYFTPIDGPVQKIHAQVSVTPGVFRSTWSYLDGFGHTVLTLTEADPGAGDGGKWIASGLPDRDSMGRVVRAYQPSFYSGVPGSYPLASSTSAASRSMTYDDFGRPTQTFDLDGTPVSRVRYHALSREQSDERQIALGLSTRVDLDGHGRTARVTRQLQKDAIVLSLGYYATGEVSTVRQSHAGDAPVTRTMQYDSLGRMVLNIEPNTSVSDPTNPLTAAAWRYAYNDAGNLVGTSDARGCGKNVSYDAGGRLLAEDYSPCLNSQAPYSAPAAAGDGTEVFNVYDAPEAGQTGAPGQYVGRLAATYDRGSHDQLAYDVRGRVVGVARQIARPDDPVARLAERYAPWWYRTSSTYDDADRAVASTTGADVLELMPGGTSTVTTSYSARGVVTNVGGSYGTLLAKQTLDADGFLRRLAFDDAVKTSAVFAPDARRRVQLATVGRLVAPSSPALLASDKFVYEAGVLKSVTDGRVADEWELGSKPVNRGMTYDDLGQLKSVEYRYATTSGNDDFSPPLLPESQAGATDYVPFRTGITKRVRSQSFDYDWMGNRVRSGDDESVFWDRSVGTATMGGAAAPNRILHSAILGQGALDASHDAAGNLTRIDVTRASGACAERGICSNRFVYDWDEVGQLARARRWDFTTTPRTEPDADLSYLYDGGGARVLKVARSGAHVASVNAEIFPTLRLEHAAWDGTDYDRNARTEVVYLAGGGMNLGRVLYAPSGVPTNGGGPLHVLLEVGNHLGSTSIVIDKETSELVERTTYQAYGATESDYRPARWHAFREPYRLSGKEEDTDVGLTYFGARYYVAALGRWASADPLTIHGLGSDLNPYAYVSGSPLAAVDPFGLDCDALNAVAPCGYGEGGGGSGENLTELPPPVPSGPSGIGGPPALTGGNGDGSIASDAMPLEDDSVRIAPPRDAPSDPEQTSPLGKMPDFAGMFKGTFDAIRAGNVSFSANDYGRSMWNTVVEKSALALVSIPTMGIPVPFVGTAIASRIAAPFQVSTGPTLSNGTLNVSGLAAGATYMGIEMAAGAGAAGLSRGAGDGMMTLYRAISEAELLDLGASGGLRAGAGSMGNKWFAESASHASSWGKSFFRMDGEAFFTLRVRIPESVGRQMLRIPMLDGIGAARSAEGSVLELVNKFGRFDVLGANAVH